ncbi:MAG: hypothetical protein HYY17_16530 [Planctomycetes bacterium]|nr:hypothetical protein [Planctomycetota bacterium]
MNESLERGIRDLVARDPRYPFEAYRFVFEALDHTVREIGERRHVTGRELLGGLRKLALDQFGGLARMVFDGWNVRGTGDFGEIVFNLVGVGLMGKTDRDSKDDFRDVYDFDDAFPRYVPPPGCTP